MRQKAALLVHIGPLREESERLLEQVNQATLLAPLISLPPVRQKALMEALPALHLADMPVTPPGGEAVCYIYALQEFNSLAPASDLTQLYPGLGQARQKTVETQTLPQALEQADLSQARLTHLVIEQPEIALSLLQAFNHSGLLEALTHLWVRSSPLRLYEGMATDTELHEWCEKNGFELASEKADDPDFFLLGFKRNPLFGQLKNAQQQLEESQQEAKKQKEQAQKQLREKDTQIHEQEAQVKQLTEESESLKKQQQQAQKQLKEKSAQLNEQEAQVKQLTEESESLKKQQQQAQKQLKEKSAQLNEQEAQVKQLTEESESLKKQQQQAQKQLKEKSAQLNEQEAQVKQLTEESDALKKQQQQAQKQLREKDTQIHEQEAQVKQLTEESESLKKQQQQAQKQLKEKSAQLNEQEAQVKQLTEESDALKKQQEQTQQQLKEKDAQINEQEAQVKHLTEECDTLKKQLNQALKASQQYQQAQEEATQQLEQTNQQLVEMQEKLAEVEKQRQQAEQQRKEAEEAHQQTQKKLEDTHTWFMSRKQQAEERAEKLKAQQTELQAKTEQAASLEEKLKVSEEDRDKYQRYFTKRKEQFEEAETQLIEAKEALKERDVTIKQLNEQLETFQHNGDRFSQLESKLDALFGEQRTYIQQTTNALGQHVTRSARQQRDEQALTHYLQHGQRPLRTQLAPGYAMALLEHYDTYHHDVVVVFGSAEITELLAQSIINARSEQPRLQNGQRKQADNDVTLSNVDLPQAIVSVEHQKKTSEELKQRLNHQRLSQAVNVVYAPWVECTTQSGNGQPILFYAAEPTLQRLNQWLPEDARVLVIVGECLAEETGQSREVTLPLLLQQLPTQRLDIVLEGSSYRQESSLKESWDKLLETRQRPGQWLTLPNTQSLRVEG